MKTTYVQPAPPPREFCIKFSDQEFQELRWTIIRLVELRKVIAASLRPEEAERMDGVVGALQQSFDQISEER